jgi:hypothetical protein
MGRRTHNLRESSAIGRNRQHRIKNEGAARQLKATSFATESAPQYEAEPYTRPAQKSKALRRP